MTDEQLRFHLEEYRILKGELAFHVKFRLDMFVWSVVASGAIAAWLVANGQSISNLNPIGARAAWFIPALIAIAGCAGYFLWFEVIRQTAGYVRRLEAAIAAPQLGWEAAQADAGRNSIGRLNLRRFGWAWTALILTDLLFAAFVR